MVGLESADAESQMDASSNTGTRFSKKVVAAVLAGAAVLLAPVAVHLLQQPAPTHSSVEYMSEEDEQFGTKMEVGYC